MRKTNYSELLPGYPVCGYVGYVPTPEAIRHGGYSATAASHTRLVPEAGWIMVETTQQLLTKTFHS